MGGCAPRRCTPQSPSCMGSRRRCRGLLKQIMSSKAEVTTTFIQRVPCTNTLSTYQMHYIGSSETKSNRGHPRSLIGDDISEAPKAAPRPTATLKTADGGGGAARELRQGRSATRGAQQQPNTLVRRMEASSRKNITPATSRDNESESEAK